jgi:transposase InsO family protein
VITALVEEAVAAGARLESACKELGIDARTIQRWGAAPDGNDERRGPKVKPANALTPAEEEDLLALLNSAEYVDLTPHQVVAKLADMKIYKASERTMYRLLKRRKLLAHRGKSRPRTVRRPAEHRATGPRQVWSWDITYLRSPIQGKFWLLYMVVDVWSRKVVAAKVHDHESDELAAALIDEACRREGIDRAGLVVHADNGNAMKGKTMLAKLRVLGIIPSFSRPRVSDDNPFSEALFRTLKYRPNYPDGPFASLEVAQAWVDDFVRWYNEDHQHSGIRFVTPVQRHDGHDIAILASRESVYAAARERTPERWTGNTRNWGHIEVVELNPAPRSGRRSAPTSSTGSPLDPSPAPSLARNRQRGGERTGAVKAGGAGPARVAAERSEGSLYGAEHSSTLASHRAGRSSARNAVDARQRTAL